MSIRMVRISDFLTDAEIALAVKLKHATRIRDRIIKPNLERINAALGIECDALYLAYMVEYAVTQGRT